MMEAVLNFRRFLLVFTAILALGCSVYSMQGKTASSDEELWVKVPLRTQAQKRAGLMGGEGMQMIFGIAYAPSNPDTVYLVSDTTQVWKSVDGGNSWQMKHKGFLANGGIAVSVDPVNENIVFVAGSLHSYSESSPADGIYRTTDGGENWTLVKSTPFFRGIEGKHFVFEPADGDSSRTKVIYAGTHQDGLLISRDGGDSWETLGFKKKRILDMEMDPSDSSLLYILTVDGLFRVTVRDYVIADTERLAKQLHGPFKTFALNTVNPSVMYVAMGKGGVYRSDDGGKWFYRLKKGLPAGLDYTYIAVSPVNPDYLYLSVDRWRGLNPLWSHDGGDVWHGPVTIYRKGLSIAGELRWFAGCVVPHPEDPDIALTAANGKARILKTDNGGISWFYSSNGYMGARKGEGITSQAFYSDPEKMIFFLMDHGPALTVDGGDTFRLLDIPAVNGRRTTRVGAVSPVDENLIVTAIGGWNIQKLAVSRNGGRSWRIIPGTEDRYKFISFHPQKPDIIYAYGFVSTDSGRTWKKLSRKIYGVFRDNGDTVYSVSELKGGKSVIYRSDDRGVTWRDTYPHLPVPMDSISEIDIDPFNPDRIYVASEHGLYIYDDKSGKWLKKGEESGLTRDRFGMMSFKCIAVDPRHPEIVYTGRWAPGKGPSNGIFRSEDFGKSWKNITYNLGPDITIWSVSVSPHDGTVYIGSSHGTWKLSPPY
ncbi:MAG: hypothetical protein GXP46_13320 [Deferribacteres bacterium]|nr:hypothetical protein [Deferribacteres bacterium]